MEKIIATFVRGQYSVMGRVVMVHPIVIIITPAGRALIKGAAQVDLPIAGCTREQSVKNKHVVQELLTVLHTIQMAVVSTMNVARAL